MTRKRIYEYTEGAVCLDIARLVHKIKDKLKAKYGKLEMKEETDLVNKSLELFKSKGQAFKFAQQLNRVGGFRWYFLCPVCGSRRSKLWYPEGIPGRSQIYACTECHKLKPMGILSPDSKKYKEIVKPLRRLESLKKKLLKMPLTDNPKAVKYIEEYDRIEEELETSAVYKLWKYQQRFARVRQGQEQQRKLLVAIENKLK